jgi:hypothetical protein
MFRTHFLSFLLCAAVLPSLRAQQQANQAVQAQQQAELPQAVQGGLVSSSMTSSQTFAPASPADSDIGEQVLLQPEQKYQAFSAWTNWNVFWTSNAQLLNDTNGGSDTFLSGTVGGSWLPHLGNNLFADFSAEQSLFRYARNGSLDFNSLRLEAGLIYVVRQLDDLTFFTHYTYDLLTSRGLNSEIYSDQVWTVGARKVWTLSRALLLYASANADFTLGGEPSYALRNEFSLLGGGQISLTRCVKLDVYYRATAQDYRYTNRADFNQLIGGGLSFEVTRWLSIQAVSTLGINSSTQSQYDYFAANLGGGVGILVNF